VQML